MVEEMPDIEQQETGARSAHGDDLQGTWFSEG
jgi:hypothetical protein